MTDSQSQNEDNSLQITAENGVDRGDMLALLHDYHQNSPSLNYSFFTGEHVSQAAQIEPAPQGAQPSQATSGETSGAHLLSASTTAYVPFAHELNAPTAEIPAPTHETENQWKPLDFTYSDLMPPASEPAFSSLMEQTDLSLGAPVAREVETPTETEIGDDSNSAMHHNEFDFSSTFNFHDSLLKIFWRIDVDRSNRIDQRELDRAVRGHWFEGDEAVLARLLLANYDLLVPSRELTDGGISIGQILEHELFRHQASEHAQRLPNEARERSKRLTTSQRPKLPNHLNRRY